MPKLVTHVFSRGLFVKADNGGMPDNILYQLAAVAEKTGRMVNYVITRDKRAYMGIVTPFPALPEKFRYAEHVTWPNGLMEVYEVPEKTARENRGELRNGKKKGRGKNA